MKAFVVAASLALQLGAPTYAATLGNPVQKALELLTTLQSRVVREGEASKKVYDEFADWCEERSRETRHSLTSMKAEEEDLTAAIEKATDSMESLGTKIEELSSKISTDEADLKAATLLRKKEEDDFSRTQKDLVETIDTIERSVRILEREARSGSFAQLKGVGQLTQTLSALVDASALASADAARLTSLVQSYSQEEEDSGELGAPDAQAYSSHSDVITETMESLRDKAEAQLEGARKTEATKARNFAVLKVSLEAKLRAGNTAMDAAKKAVAEAGQKKATAQGDLSVTLKDVKEAKADLSDLRHNCMSKAADFEEEMKVRGEELAALAKAKKIVADMTGAASKQTYSLAQEQATDPSQAASFLQVEAESTSEDDPPAVQAVHLVKKFARQSRLKPLMLLSFRLDSVLRSAAVSGADPFSKVRTLITGMIRALEAEASTEAQHKAWCDKELTEAKTKKATKEAEIDKLTTKLDQLSAGLTNLAEEVAVLQKELSELARSQAEMTRIRGEEHLLFVQQKAEMEEGIKGVKLALKTLREYYAQADNGEQAGDGGGGIIGLLEVIESDFSKGLAELLAAEEASQNVFREESKETEVNRATKEVDVRHKSKMLKANEKTSTELSGDRDGEEAELSAVGEYLSRLQEQCVAKEEPYEERKARRDQSMANLKEALQLLAGQPASFVEVDSSRRPGHLRGVQDAGILGL